MILLAFIYCTYAQVFQDASIEYLLPLDKPYLVVQKTQFFSYGYWFKYQPLNQLSKSAKLTFTQSNGFQTSNNCLISSEIADDNTLSIWHYQTDSFNHVVSIISSEGLQTYQFQQDKLQYEGRWNFFGIQILDANQYQIIFYDNTLKITQIDGFLKRKILQDYYLGYFGAIGDNQGQIIYYQQFKGRLTNFIELQQIVTQTNFADVVLNISPQGVQGCQKQQKLQYFDLQYFDGQTVQKYKYTEYREGVRYAISMWVKSDMGFYTQPINQTILRVTLSEYYIDNYLGVKQLYLQYQNSIAPEENIVFIMTYSYETPVYSIQMINNKDWQYIIDSDLQLGLKQWHFIQFEYGRNSQPNKFPPIYNSLFTLNLPTIKKQYKRDWKRQNYHFTGVPIYFYLGGGISEYENKFIGRMSKLTFITCNTADLSFSIICDNTCLTCIGPTSSDCLTCETSKNRVFSLNKCVCQLGYVAGVTQEDSTCELASSRYPMIQFIETEYRCSDGYDQCQEKIICSFGYFKNDNKCFQCPQQPSQQISDIIFCIECVLNPETWQQICQTNLELKNSQVFHPVQNKIIQYELNFINDNVQMKIFVQDDIICQEGYGYNNQRKLCIKCENCKICAFEQFIQICSQCNSQQYLNNGKCYKCGYNCQSCDQNGCFVCQDNYFLTLDKVNCQICTIQNCKYCYQYYQDSNQKLFISLDLKFQKIDLTTDGIVTSCARCDDQYSIMDDICVETVTLPIYVDMFCKTGIYENDYFQCLIGYFYADITQLDDCPLINNCYSCFYFYPYDPYCILCRDGYYFQFEDGICYPCPDTCKTCIRQNTQTKDQWKVNVRALYYYKFSQHLYEDYAIDNVTYSYNIACTSCQQGFIVYQETCIPGCPSSCLECEVRDGKAICLKCQGNLFGPLNSVDGNQNCLDCPQKCQACIYRSSADLQQLNKQFNTNLRTNYENKCYLYDNTYFLDNELGLAVQCENSKKCFKSIIITLDIYCDEQFIKSISNCHITNTQYCLQDIFDSGLIEYMKKQVTKDIEIILNIQSSPCIIDEEFILTQQISQQILSLNKSTLTIQSLDTTIILDQNVILSNFSITNLNRLNIQQRNGNQIIISGDNIKYQNISVLKSELGSKQLILKANNFKMLDINNLTINYVQIELNHLFQITTDQQNQINIKISNLFIKKTNFSKSGLFNFTNLNQNIKLDFTFNNLIIIESQFQDCQSFIYFSQTLNILPLLQNIRLENCNLKNSQFIQISNVLDSSKFANLIILNSTFYQSILFQIPILDFQDCQFIQNKIYLKSQFIQNAGSFSSVDGFFYFKQLMFQQNTYDYGSQFININQQEQTNLSVYFDGYHSIQNQLLQQNSIEFSYEISLIFLNASLVYINNFNVDRRDGSVELSIIQTQEIIIKSLTIQTNNPLKLITSKISCSIEQKNLVIYIFDTKKLVVDTFNIKFLGSSDYSIIIVQSQSVLKKQQNEVITFQNGVIANNSLIIRNFNKQTSIIQINSQQPQLIYFFNYNYTQNILNFYVQDLQKISASTLLIQSDYGSIVIDDCNFHNNYAINSTNSPIYVQSYSIQISNSVFKNNNVFDLEILKNFLVLSYKKEVSLEQIQFIDFPIQSNGGSGQLIAQLINISNIIVNGSYGANGGSFYIISQGQSLINIKDSSIDYSQTSDTLNSNGGVFYVDSSKSNLFLQIKNFKTSYAKSRNSGGFIYLTPSNFTIHVTQLQCFNCFSINGGLMMIDSQDQFTTPNVKMDDVTLSNPNFRWFLENIINITVDEQQQLSKNSYLLYLNNVILNAYKLHIYDGNFFGLIFFKGYNGLMIDGVKIEDYQPYQISLITISHSQNTKNLISLINFNIRNIQQEEILNQSCQNQIIQFNQSQDCQIDKFNIKPQGFSSLFTEQYKNNTFNCNYQDIYQRKSIYLASVEIFNFSNNYLKIENVQFYNLNYYKLDYGLMSFRDFPQLKDQVQINQLQMIDNQCGTYGCLLLASSSSNFINNNRRILENIEILELANSSIVITDSQFINNQATYGSGIYIDYTSVLIKNTLFLSNIAKIHGGAIYFISSQQNMILIENQFINNSALNLSGSGIYLQSVSMPQLNGLNNIFLENQQDFNEIPQQLQILFNNNILDKKLIINETKIAVELVQIQPYKILGQQNLVDTIILPSGQQIKDYQYFDQFDQYYIPYNLSLRIIPINRFNQQLMDQQIKLKLSARVDDQNFSSTKYFNQDIFPFDNISQSFNLDDLIIYFSPYEELPLEIKAESPKIMIPQYSLDNPYDILSYQSYELRFWIQTFKCQIGQFFNETSKYCQECSGNTYTVEINSKLCQFIDENFIANVSSAQIQLKSGCWRAYVFSQKIDSCYHLYENCVGGWGIGNQLCAEGHIGALCEQCDLYNIKGNGSYSVSSLYSCGSCNASVENIISMILISLWMIISIIMSVDSTIELLKDHIYKTKFISLGFLLQSVKPNPAFLIKILSNYLQIITTVTTFQLKVPPGLTSVFNSAANPMNQIAYRLDCFLIDLTDTNIIYFRIMWSIILALVYIQLYLLGYLLLVLFKKTQFNISAIITCFIYLFIYIQPNLISSLIQLVSFRIISNEYWISGNVSYRYDTKTHASWLLSFVFPTLLLVGILIPVFLWYGVYKNRDNLNDTKIKQIWGYLYNEYRKEVFFWETIKIIQKDFIIIGLAYYEDYIPIKAALVFVILFLYSFTTIKYKPYNQGLFNKLDSQQTIVCAVSIILATTIYTAQQYELQEIIWPFYIIISLLNLLFVVELLWILLQAYIQNFETQLDQIKDKISLKYPSLSSIFENQSEKKLRIKKRFMQIKNYLIPQARLVILFKKCNNISLSQKKENTARINTKVEQSQLQFQPQESPINRQSIQEDDYLKSQQNENQQLQQSKERFENLQ
ncbi:hypothetical protein pb186bvf_020559 [Paramecium bursaria]